MLTMMICTEKVKSSSTDFPISQVVEDRRRGPVLRAGQRDMIKQEALKTRQALNWGKEN